MLEIVLAAQVFDAETQVDAPREPRPETDVVR